MDTVANPYSEEGSNNSADGFGDDQVVHIAEFELGSELIELRLPVARDAIREEEQNSPEALVLMKNTPKPLAFEGSDSIIATHNHNDFSETLTEDAFDIVSPKESKLHFRDIEFVDMENEKIADTYSMALISESPKRDVAQDDEIFIPKIEAQISELSFVELQNKSTAIWVDRVLGAPDEPEFIELGNEPGEVRQGILVGSNELTQQLLIFPVEAIVLGDEDTESDTARSSRSDQVFEQLAVQIEAADVSDEVREEGAFLIESMHETTQQIQETVRVLQMEIAYLAESQELQPELSAIILSEKPVNIQQIIETFAEFEENELPESVVKIYRELLEKVLLLQKMSEQFGLLFTIAYDPVTHSLKLIPTENSTKDPMHEMFSTFAKNIDGPDESNEYRQKGLIHFIGSLVTRKTKLEYDLAA